MTVKVSNDASTTISIVIGALVILRPTWIESENRPGGQLGSRDVGQWVDHILKQPLCPEIMLRSLSHRLTSPEF